MRLAFGEIELGSLDAGAPAVDAKEICDRLMIHLLSAQIIGVTPKEKVTEDQARERQQADGFEIGGTTYIKPDRFKDWVPAQAERALLKRNNVLQTERADTATVERKIAGIEGKPRYYAIDRAALIRLTEAE
jgi:hypothetical protein